MFVGPTCYVKAFEGEGIKLIVALLTTGLAL
jgi:hypothetical protein